MCGPDYELMAELDEAEIETEENLSCVVCGKVIVMSIENEYRQL